MDISPVIISLKTSLVAVFFTIIIGIVIAKYVVTIKNEKVKAIIDSILTIPLVFPPTVLGFILLMIFSVQQPVGKFFNDTLNWPIPFTWSATVIAAIVVSLPLMYRSTRSALEQVDKNYINSAKSLGIKNKTIFFKIELPLAINGIIAGAILAFARGLGEFGATAMIAGNIANETRTLPLAIYSKVVANKADEAYNYVLILVIICFIIVIIMNLFLAKERKYK